MLPTKLPLERFYEELVRTQAVINRKFLGVSAVAKTVGVLGRQLMRGQTNFARMIWKFNSVYNPRRQYADHFRKVHYELPAPKPQEIGPRERTELYVHHKVAAEGRS